MEDKHEEIAFTYKNHSGTKNYDVAGDFWWGKIIDDKHLVTYEAKFEEHLEFEFRDSVSQFLLTKKKLGIKL